MSKPEKSTFSQSNSSLLSGHLTLFECNTAGQLELQDRGVPAKIIDLIVTKPKDWKTSLELSFFRCLCWRQHNLFLLRKLTGCYVVVWVSDFLSDELRW